jgi:parallel beta-helix repeat protein
MRRERGRDVNQWTRWLVMGLMLSFGVGLTGFLVPTAEATNLSCGQNLGPGGSFSLDASLTDCPGQALVVISAQLNLNGHTVSCASESDTGIRILGSGSRVTNGTVTRCGLGVDVAGDGGHTVEQVTATDNNVGFVVTSGSDSELHANAAIDNDLGFIVQASNNRLTGNTASANVTSFNLNGGSGNELSDNVARDSVFGFQVAAAGMTLIRNTASGNRAGFLVLGNGSELSENVASGNLSGILVQSGAEANRLRSNAAAGNSSVDLIDENASCGSNQWQSNSFGLASEACIR